MNLLIITNRCPCIAMRYAMKTAVLLTGLMLFWQPVLLEASTRETVLERIEQESATYTDAPIESVQPLTEKSVLARERYQGGTFRVLVRKDKIERFRCSSCHTSAPQQVMARSGAPLTHGDIQLNHGQAASLSCIDCHHADERDYLEDKKGNKIDFDHSYQLCGQCHFRQKSDWIGGAHGKRAEYWAGERIIFNCTTCHNPHSPKFAKRFPVTYSAPVKRQGSDGSPKE
jgi:hypothetical protein